MIRRASTADAPHNRFTGLPLAAAADVAEKSLGVTTWRGSNPGAAGWLGLLVAHTGYQLAGIEVTAMKATTPGWKPPRPARAAAPTHTARTARPAEEGVPATTPARSKARGRAAE